MTPPRIPRAIAGLFAITLAACGSDAVSPDLDLRGERTPTCSNPAPLLGTRDPRAPNLLVQFKPGVDPAAETARLAAAHGFSATHVYLEFAGFAAPLSPAATAAVRCAPSVQLVEHDGIVTTQ
ncbi:MAG: hypothetical protein MUD17_12830 [Gemmatimonadaceae bacterium]|jgi:hypothetical protein|nr:hypothetical protein [Gemmatimonadaceae bacterium]